jgi:hypothetical protein
MSQELRHRDMANHGRGTRKNLYLSAWEDFRGERSLPGRRFLRPCVSRARKPHRVQGPGLSAPSPNRPQIRLRRHCSEYRGTGILDCLLLAGTLALRQHPPPLPKMARQIQDGCLRRGLIVELDVRSACVVRFLSPLIVSRNKRA